MPDCTRRVAGSKGAAARYCPHHLRRLQNYGSATDWKPIARYDAPGAPESYVEMLADMPWPQLVNWCEMILHYHEDEER